MNLFNSASGDNFELAPPVEDLLHIVQQWGPCLIPQQWRIVRFAHCRGPIAYQRRKAMTFSAKKSHSVGNLFPGKLKS